MNGKHKTLLTWLGKSDRPVAMTASGRTALTSSGMISGTGLARAMTIGRSGHARKHVRLQDARRGKAEEDVGPVDGTSARVRASVALA